MKFRFLALLSALLLYSSLLSAQKYHVLIGGREGIFTYDFNAQTGEITQKSKVTPGTSFLTVAADLKHVYSATGGATISSFTYNSTTGELAFVNNVPIINGSAYVSVDAKKKYVFSASYGGGALTAIPVEADGSLGKDIQTIKYEGKSIAKDKPFVHSVILSPDNKYVLTADLGTDKLNIFAFDASKRPNPLTPGKQPFYLLEGGAGPRHSIFHPNGKFYYAVTELNSTVSAFKYKKGKITHLQTITMIPPGYTGIGDGADIRVSPDGKFVYANTRNALNEIVIYAVDQKKGTLTLAGRAPTLGRSARTFAIDPTGNYAIVTNSASNDVYVFKRDQSTGLLTPTGKKLEIVGPGIVTFVEIK